VSGAVEARCATCGGEERVSIDRGMGPGPSEPCPDCTASCTVANHELRPDHAAVMANLTDRARAASSPGQAFYLAALAVHYARGETFAVDSAYSGIVRARRIISGVGIKDHVLYGPDAVAEPDGERVGASTVVTWQVRQEHGRVVWIRVTDPAGGLHAEGYLSDTPAVAKDEPDSESIEAGARAMAAHQHGDEQWLTESESYRQAWREKATRTLADYAVLAEALTEGVDS
jgi:hypothetical protein